ncbi:hypothetical protein [Streptomyces sp. NPDC059906]|uniref:hypothetical protein n=1 Tax=Streptomyces sp. NPDC059906 TaxID=3346997 RepID=UPI00364E05ED
MTPSMVKAFRDSWKRKTEIVKLGRNGYVVAIVAIALVTLGGAAYLFRIPPFSEKKGEINASAVCQSLGSASKATTVLTSVLAEASSYAFDDEVHLRGDDDDSYRSHCFVSGDGDQLMSVTSEMMRDEPLEDWVESEVAESAGQQRLSPFLGDVKSAASESVAAIFMPCVSPGNIPGGQYNISVVVHLKNAKNVSSTDRQNSLIELAKGAAAYAHDKGKCNAPSELSA